MEDDMLWTKMLLIGVKCSNINDYLVYARTGIDMIKRRGGYEYFKKYKNISKLMQYAEIFKVYRKIKLYLAGLL